MKNKLPDYSSIIILQIIFEQNFNQFISLFNNIEYIDPSVDYDKFCKINQLIRL